MIKNKILPAIALAVLATSILGVTQVHAQSKNTDFFSGLVNFIAQKFGLDKTQVQTAVNDYKTQNKQNRQQNMQDNQKKRLDALVTSGKITSDQEKAILAELSTLQSKYNPANFKNLTPAQRKTQVDQERAELKAWAKTNNININQIMPRFGKGLPGSGMHKGWGNKPSPSPTP